MKSTDWLNHIQFSPNDPEQVMYSHEGPWHKVDRIWLTNIHGKTPKKNSSADDEYGNCWA